MGSKLEELGIEARKKLIVNNIYNNEQDANNYNQNHSRALADTETPIHGKGTSDADIEGASVNYKGGGSEDREKRTKLLVKNKYGVDENKHYDKVFPGISDSIVNITAGGLNIAK